MTMYVQFLATAVATHPSEELPSEALHHSAAWWRQRVTSSQRLRGVTAEHRLCDEVAYDRALVALSQRHGITIDLARFDDRTVERQRLENALAGAGVDVRIQIGPPRSGADPGWVLQPA